MPPYRTTKNTHTNKEEGEANNTTQHQPAKDLRCMVCTAKNTQCIARAASMNCRVGCIPPPSLLRLMNRCAMAAAAAVKAMSMTGMTLVASLSSYEMCEPPGWVNDADIYGAVRYGTMR